MSKKMSDWSTLKILILGARGQIGKELCRALDGYGNIVELDYHSSRWCGDLRDQVGLSATVRALRPDIIINAAAYTKVDLAESNQPEAFVSNFNGVKTLADEANKVGAVLVHFSTDYVYDGSLKRPYTETDTTNPINVYGNSKLKGDLAIIESGCKYLIFRTSWVYSWHGNNFLKTILRLAQSNESLRVVNDQIGVPTCASLIADVTAHCLQSLNVNAGLSGIYNLVPSGQTSWYDYALYAINIARDLGAPIKISNESLLAIPTKECKTQVKRLLNCYLGTGEIRTVFNIELPSWEKSVNSTVLKLV